MGMTHRWNVKNAVEPWGETAVLHITDPNFQVPDLIDGGAAWELLARWLVTYRALGWDLPDLRGGEHEVIPGITTSSGLIRKVLEWMQSSGTQ